MENGLNLRRFFDALKQLTWWQRLFGWKPFRALSYAAHEEFVVLLQQGVRLHEALEILKTEREIWVQEQKALHEKCADLKTAAVKAETHLQQAIHDSRRLEQEIHHIQKKLHDVEQLDVQRKKDHDNRMIWLQSLQESVEKEKQAAKALEKTQAEEKHALLKETWKRHEESVRNRICSLAERHGIEVVAHVPFKGKPDNVIRICGEYIVFDAKSPASDDLGNFNNYIRTQAEAVAKYTSDVTVRKDIYLVVPANTLDVLKEFSFNKGNYQVYVITLDALETVMISLKKIEEYEFAEQLSPEDRQSICRIIGGLIYTSKRRIQVDQFFNGHLLSLLSQTERDLPEAMQEEIARHQKAMKLNPEVDKRSKEIRTESLLKKEAQLEGQARIFQIFTPQQLHLDTVANGEDFDEHSPQLQHHDRMGR